MPASLFRRIELLPRDIPSLISCCCCSLRFSTPLLPVRQAAGVARHTILRFLWNLFSNVLESTGSRIAPA